MNTVLTPITTTMISTPGPLEENPIWLRDNVSLTSVGIDIGSAGTQVIFSTVHLQRKADSHASRYVIVDRATAYQSPVSLTPYAGEMIDAAALGAIIDDAYAGAAILPTDIDTGVVILTGEALRRENAQTIAEVVSAKGGDFVTATAGNHMEALLAAYGSGAAKASFDAGSRILNVDIGGGTTKLALCDKGEVLWTAALHIGGRLIAVEDQKVIRAEAAGIHHAAQAGVKVAVGSALSAPDLENVAIHLADVLQTAIRQRPLPDAVSALFLTDIPDDIGSLDGIMVSGGVGEYVAGRETRDFGDLGLPLGRALRERTDSGDLGAPLIPAAACIRATALGASEYSVQLSGQTSTVTAPGKLLPRPLDAGAETDAGPGDGTQPQSRRRCDPHAFRRIRSVPGHRRGRAGVRFRPATGLRHNPRAGRRHSRGDGPTPERRPPAVCDDRRRHRADAWWHSAGRNWRSE